MAKFTEVLHDLLSNEETNALIQKAMSTYKLYNPEHKELYGYIPTRDELNKKILNHYRFYEIGSETIGRFLYNLETTLNEIMPYYNQLYKSVDIMNNIEDIFANVDVTETFEEDRVNNTLNSSSDTITGSMSTSSSESVNGSTSSKVDSSNSTDTDMSTSGRNVKSNTPQSQLSVKSIDNITSASEIGWNEDSNNSSSTSTDTSSSSGTNQSSSTGSSESENSQETSSNSSRESTDTTTHTMNKKGNQGVNTYAHDMLEFRQLFLNIEQQIINDPELAKCFMLVW